MVIVQMEKRYPDIIQWIEKNNMDLAIKQLVNTMAKDCIPLIQSKNHQLTHYEALSVFYHAFLELSQKVKKGDFKYQNEAAFETYFKTACYHQGIKYRRDFSPQYLIPVEIFEFIRDEVENSLHEEEEIFRTEKKGMELLDELVEDIIGTNDRFDIMEDVVKVFHTLNDRCKFLIVLKFFLSLTHRQIVDALHLFYEIKSEDVCKTNLYRCLVQIRERLSPASV